MDLKSMLNDRPVPEKRSSTLQSESRGSGSAPLLSPPPPVQNGSHVGASYAVPRHPSGQQTPLYTPQAGPQAQSRVLTPLHTPSQASGGGQYPFPSQALPQQSPASAHPSQQSYRSFEPQSATTPGPRPASHGYPYPHRSPSMSQYHQAINPHATASLSPTPPSHHSQTSHSVRQSPASGLGHPPPQQPGQYPQPQLYHQSQPNTPLGPPQLPQRYSNSQLDVSSPHHSRTLSSASSVLAAGSPHHHGSINSIVESPSMLNRPSPQMRRTSDYRSSLDRERSVSVSPKTMVPPRSSSHGSRHSSQQDLYSARSSLQASTSVSVAPHPETPGHVPPQTPTYAQQSHSLLAGEVAQNKPSPSATVGPSMNGNSLSQMDNKLPLQHQPQKMGMRHLLAPTDHSQEPSLQNGTLDHGMPPKANGSRQSHEHSLPPAASHSAAPPMQQQHQQQAQAQAKQGFTQDHSTLISNGSVSQLPAKTSAASETAAMSRAPAAQLPSKRPAESDISPPPSKRRRRQRDRPVWAQLAPQNPRAKSVSQPQAQPMAQPPKQNLPAPPAAVTPVNGGRWEKSLKNMEPLPALNKAILDHLWQNLQANADIGHDPREGTIEIEAKIGTLKDVDTQNRWALRSLNTVVIDPLDNRKFRFESEMNEVSVLSRFSTKPR